MRCAVAAAAPMVLAMVDKPPAKRALDAAAELPACASIARSAFGNKPAGKESIPSFRDAPPKTSRKKTCPQVGGPGIPRWGRSLAHSRCCSRKPAQAIPGKGRGLGPALVSELNRPGALSKRPSVGLVLSKKSRRWDNSGGFFR
jgi:hypothetical protein